MRRGSWKTRIGIYLAAIGSAFGLGCLWRFPYVVAENGGGAFVVLYLFMFILIGVPLLVGELIIGKVTRRSVVGAQRQLVAQMISKSGKESWGTKFLPVMSFFCVAVCLLILSYYSVICGWVLYFLAQFSLLPFAAGNQMEVAESLNTLNSNGWLQWGLTAIHILVLLVIVARDVEDGIERWVGLIIPVFIGILAVLISQSLWVDSDQDVWRYFFYPDLTQLNLNSLGAAIGHVCFTLSIGFGTMVTFGSYLKEETSVPGTGFRVSVMDSLAALVSAVLVFPLLGEVLRENAGPDLLFRTVPNYLLKFQGGHVYGLFFFICLYLAALGASLSLLETVVANMREGLSWRRGKSTWVACAIAIVCALPAAFSSSWLSNVKWRGKGLLQSIDHIVIDWIVPLFALFFCLVVVHKVSEKWKNEEFSVNENNQTSMILYSHWSILMKWVIPFVILLGLFLQLVKLFL